MRFIPIFLWGVMTLWPFAAQADIFRYETDDGEIVLTTEPRKDKGLKLLEVIRDTTSRSASKTSESSRVGTSKTSEMPSAFVPGERRMVQAMPAKSSREHAFDAYIREAAELYGIPEAFIRAVIKVESNFNPNAVSRVGAMGLMQLMPGTAEHMKVGDPFDPRQNILGGTRYLRRLSDKYDGDINLVLSGYHAGPGNVAKVGGIPFEKTQKYVRDVYHWYKKYRGDE